MRRLIALLAVAAMTAATAQTSPQNPAPSVPKEKGPQVVHVEEREFAPGATSGWPILAWRSPISPAAKWN